jgi:helicase MOV-10
MMERLMKLDKYKFTASGSYDKKYIVQLTKNYRSHRAIIEFSNQEFYNNRLECFQKKQVADFAIGWNHLPNTLYPVIFQCSWVASLEIDKGLYNEGDIQLVKGYVDALLREGINGKAVEPDDIGIITPYNIQREMLKDIFQNGIEIGTTEYFQGREKLIIIFSCVRSQTETVGFLKNEKRLNVALTRAKALLIVIGNPETLGKDRRWRKFIDLCRTKNAVVNATPPWVIERTKGILKFEKSGSDDVKEKSKSNDEQRKGETNLEKLFRELNLYL